MMVKIYKMFNEILKEICISKKHIRFPLRSRDVARIVELMEPHSIDLSSGLRAYVWSFIDKGVIKVVYGIGKEYVVKFKRRRVRDLLSNLYLVLRFPEGFIDDCLAWYTVWSGTFFEARFSENLSVYYCT